MARSSPIGLWREFLALPNESRVKAFGMALLVSITCALAVSTSAVLLAPRRQAQVEAAHGDSLIATLRARPGVSRALADADAAALHAHLVDLRRGEIIAGLDAAGFDADAAARHPETSTAIPESLDLAGLGRRASLAVVYLVGDARAPSLVVLPARGQGYQSMLRAYIALESDLETVAALNVYDQRETPGLGDRIGEPAWLRGFAGKRVYGPDGSVALRVSGSTARGPHRVDAIGGATRSCAGVEGLVRYWLGPHGYGPFLRRLKGGR